MGLPKVSSRVRVACTRGTPLSPLLFLFVADALSSMLNRGQEEGLLRGIPMPGLPNPITHIQFTDDTLIFLEASEANIANLHISLRCFEAVSGLRINMYKSRLLGTNIPSPTLQAYADSMGCKVASFPTHFLGLPLCVGRPLNFMWDKIINKFHRFLASWKCRYLSLGGRLTLIKAALSSLPLFFMSLFRCPAQVLKTMDKIRRDFLWFSKDNQRKFHPLEWSEVCKVFRGGGASIKNLKSMNLALLGKWVWLFASEREAQWVKIVRGKYGVAPGDLWPKALSSYKASHIWKGILRIQNHVIQHSCLELGNGSTICFWEDSWLGELPLKIQFPLLYRLSPERDICIINCYSLMAGRIVWDIRCFRNLDDSEALEFQTLMESLLKASPNVA
ncbi:uncharacterized protein LOC131230485 [Magnolia sinica]|uniref:uncharacterized protein LOC131230485 n=1 Tax=Magnolia sinica TaxID=86752 RepID=UPI002659C918|nr:uncharacterized protein LOC131230485 [Magnolia sinica]